MSAPTPPRLEERALARPSRAEVAAAASRTASTIAAVQLDSGMIPWSPGGHADVWNHVEAAMALSAFGERSAAERAYHWLETTQLESGAWHAAYRGPTIEQDHCETNAGAYVAVGMWHHYLVSGSRSWLAELWPVLDRALSFVVALQAPDGTIPWAVGSNGAPGDHALVAGGSSISMSLRCGARAATVLGHRRPQWTVAAERLAEAIAGYEDRFADKGRYAMDWYYPVLCGVLGGSAALDRIERGWERFVLPGEGVRCVEDRLWVTTAETSECALALARLGRRAEALELLDCARRARLEDGSYLTGVVHPEGQSYPIGEATTYSAAAHLLALDACHQLSGGARLFLDG